MSMDDSTTDNTMAAPNPLSLSTKNSGSSSDFFLTLGTFWEG